jgi:hypothetical protein
MENQKRDTFESGETELEANDLSRAEISKLYVDVHHELTQMFNPTLPDFSKLFLEEATYLSYDTFTCFPRLPLELRLAIWEKAANIPRIIVLHQEPYRTYGCVKVCEQRSMDSIPITLRICSESRNATFGRYNLIFGSHTFQTDPLPWPARLLATTIPSNQNRLHNTFIRSPRVYFNKLVDTVYFSETYCDVHKALWECNDLPVLRSIALDVDMVLKAETNTLLGIFETHPIDEIILVMRNNRWPIFEKWPAPKGEMDFVELEGEFETRKGEKAIGWLEEVHERHMNHMPSHEMGQLGPQMAGHIIWGKQWYADIFNIALRPEPGIEATEIGDENVDDMIEEEATNHVRFKVMGVARGGVRL